MRDDTRAQTSNAPKFMKAMYGGMARRNDSGAKDGSKLIIIEVEPLAHDLLFEVSIQSLFTCNLQHSVREIDSLIGSNPSSIKGSAWIPPPQPASRICAASAGT